MLITGTPSGWYDYTSVEKTKAFIGILIMMGVLSWNVNYNGYFKTSYP